MMKKVIACLVMVALVGPVAPAFSQTSTTGPSGTSTAVVVPQLEFAMRIVKRMESGQSDPWLQGTDVSASPSFNFGNLVPVTNAQGAVLYMRGTYFYFVLLMASTSGRRYKISETGTQLTGPAGSTVPRTSVLLMPDYQWLDEIGGVAQGAPPGTAYVGSVTSACNTDSLVYQSGSAPDAVGRIVRAAIGIGGPAAGENYPANWSRGYNGSTGQGTKQFYTSWTPVTPDQVSGTYTGSITFTLVLN